MKRGKRILLLLLFCFIFIFVIGFVKADNPDATALIACGDLSADTYYNITQNIQGTTNCFNITGDNIVLDCASYTVNYSTTGAGYAINNSNSYNNITIKNCYISDVSGSYFFGYAIYFKGSSTNPSGGNVIDNNTILISGGSGYGIYLYDYVNKTNITNNNITTTGNTGYGIYLKERINSTIVKNNSIKTSNSNAYGIYVTSYSGENIVENNNITAGAFTTIYFSSYCYKNNITNNNITSTSTSGIHFFNYVDYGYIENNSITAGNYGIHFQQNNDNYTVKNNNITTTGSSDYGIYLLISSDNNFLDNNKITTSGTNAHGIYLGSLNNILSRNYISVGAAIGIYLSSSKENNLTNNNITNDGTRFGFDILDSTTLDDYNHSIDTSNIVNGKPIYYFVTNDSIIFENMENFSFLYIVNSNDSIIRNITAENKIVLVQSSNATVEKNNINSTDIFSNRGIFLNLNSTYNNITGNNITTQGSTGDAIYINHYSDSNIIDKNNITTSTGIGIGLYNYIKYTKITNNNITTTQNDGEGVHLSSRINSTIIKNNSIKTSGSTAYGIYASSYSGENIIENNNITTGASAAIYFLSYCYKNNITNNNLTASGSYGIHFYNYVDYGYIENNSITTGHYGIHFQQNNDNYTIKNNNITTTGDYDSGIYLGTSNNHFLDNNNITTVGTGSHGIHLFNSRNNDLHNSTIKTTGAGNAVYFSGASNMTIKNTIINSTDAGTTSIYFETGSKGDLNLTDCTFNKSDVGFHASAGTTNLNNHYRLDASVNYTTDGSAIQDANVFAYDINGTEIFNKTTNSDGNIDRQLLLEFTENATQKYMKTNYSMNATNGTLWSNTTEQVNLTTDFIDENKIQLWIGAAADNSPPAITIHSPENTSYAAGTTSLGFNVSLDEEGSWCAYSLNNAANVTMTQFNVTYYNYTKTGLTAGSYNVSFSCNDTSNNFNATSIIFQITSTSTSPVQEEEPGGGGVILPYCGDGICNANEDCINCPEDCDCCFELCETYAVIPGNNCCENLTASTIYDMDCFASSGSCSGCEMIGASICTKCGNGLCEYCENYCNCPDDCETCENLWMDVEIFIGIEGNFLQRIFAGIFGIKI